MISGSGVRSTEIALPAAALTGVRDALVRSVGPVAAATALREAGYAAGDALFRNFAGTDAETPIHQLADTRFWERLRQLFTMRGWGSLRHAAVHDGVGALDTADWIEADPLLDAAAPACHFTTGLLANLLGQVAAAEVAVLEVECRSAGDDRCRFLFGGRTAVYAVYERLGNGAEPAGVLALLD